MSDPLSDTPVYREVLAADDEFQEQDLGGMSLSGRAGFHSFYNHDNALENATHVALHDALDDALEMVALDGDLAADEYGEGTPETMAKLLDSEIRHIVGRPDFFVEKLVEAFERELRGHVEACEDGDSA